MKKVTFLFLLLLLHGLLIAGKNDPPAARQLFAHRIQESIKIDGKLDDGPWQSAPIATNFIQNGPNPGEPGRQRTEVRVLYDDGAIYIGAKLLDKYPDSILMELTDRDDLGNTDYFGVIIDAYQDGNNGVGFIVTPAGIQYDIKYSALNGGGGVRSGDTNWDAVWDSQTQINSEGWVVEIKIPYAAIRFPNKPEQSWNVNFVRELRRARETSFWNEVNPNIDGLLIQSGKLHGLQEIKSPVRLSATPFIAGYVENYYDRAGSPRSNWGRSFNGGMDIKFGINDAFTLDMTLIPDFGEARSDNQVLNLSPFEVRFNENRQFFTEGVELFNKGGLFYSRRIGGRPLRYFEVADQLQVEDTLLQNPVSTQLINATKLSGRTNNGLGIGLFNATAGQSSAVIENRETGEQRHFITNPLTNYNVVVFDQNLKNNSYVTLLNTNVMRAGSAYDANTTGLVFNLRNKANSYATGGKAVLSQKYTEEGVELGHTASLNLNKISGRWQWGVGYSEESDTYDINDLGFLYNNNERSFSGRVNFNQFEPFGAFNEGGGGMFMRYSRLYNPNVYSDFGMDMWGWLQTRSFFSFGASLYLEPFTTYDYFEARTEGRYYTFPKNGGVNGWFSTDYRKKFALDMRANYRKFDEEGRYRLFFRVSPRYRFSDRFNLRFRVNAENAYNDVGFVDRVADTDVIFGIRDRLTIENSLTANFTFSNRMVLSFRMRHYWASVKYHQFRLLETDGSLGPTDYNLFSDNTFNAFNIDAIYRWRFAPGSDIFIVWKNAVLDFVNEMEWVQYDYFDGLQGLGRLPQSNSLSIKVIYFLDYQSLVPKKG